MRLIFIADIHLSSGRPATAIAFRNFLTETARFAAELYILGDLFDLWIGDDARDSFAQSIMQDLHELTQVGVPVWLMPGNHDFLYGKDFINISGCQLIPDPYLINLDGQTILLTHGDLLCTDDYSYQDFRRLVRNPAWQAQQLNKPITVRQALAQEIQKQIKILSAEKHQVIMDVNTGAIESLLMTHQARYLIHGHTHRPGIHQIGNAVRIVLSDWNAPDELSNEQARGGYLEWQGNAAGEKWRLVNLQAHQN